MEQRLQDTSCRRRACRIPLPVELQFTTSHGVVRAALRDVCLEDGPHQEVVGFGLFHKDYLPLNQLLHCVRLSETNLLDPEFEITLLWTRDFGPDGFLSGGQITWLTEHFTRPICRHSDNEQ